MPAVSIVIPAYNAAKTLEQTVHSVLEQTFSDFELLIIDDCSKDATYALAQNLAQSDPRIRVLQNERNSGVAHTRNYGIREAVGEYIALLDSDDLWTEDKLERQLALARTTGADIVYCSYDFIDAAGESMHRTFTVPEKTDFTRMLVRSELSCSSVLVRAELMKQHPFIKDYYHEDYVLWLELLRSGATARGCTETLMHYRRILGSRSDDKRNAAKYRWRIYREYLHFSPLKSAWYFTGYFVYAVKKYFL